MWRMGWILLTATGSAMATESAEALRYRLLTKLLSSGQEKLASIKGCSFSAGDTPANRVTIAHWVAWNLSFFERGVDNSLSASCKTVQKNRVMCELFFNADSKGESPWSCGFRFEEPKGSKAIDLKTLECLGSC